VKRIIHVLKVTFYRGMKFTSLQWAKKGIKKNQIDFEEMKDIMQ